MGFGCFAAIHDGSRCYGWFFQARYISIGPYPGMNIADYSRRCKTLSGNLLVAVVADELEEAALHIAGKEGAKAVTILSARGIGFPEHVTFFGVTYQGLEKVLLWLLDEESAQRIASRLNIELELLKPFQGLAFSLPVAASGGVDMEAVQRFYRQQRANR